MNRTLEKKLNIIKMINDLEDSHNERPLASTGENSETNPILLILGISSFIFFSVFLFCSYISDIPNHSGLPILNSVKNPTNSSSPSLPKINAPTIVNVIPVQPSRASRYH